MSSDADPQSRRLADAFATEPGAVASLVWVLEDSPLQATFTRRALEEHHTVEVFTDGSTLLESLANGGQPDVLVLDWELPGLSGLEVTRAVREQRDEASLPILILTMRGSTTDLVVAFSGAANDFMTKPFRAPELAARVALLLRVRRLHLRALQAEQQRSDLLDLLRQEGAVRERFMGILGHDLRSPLGAITMGAKMLRQQFEGAPETRRVLDLQLRSAQRIERMILSLLEVTRIRRAEGLELIRQPMDLHALCENLVREAEASHPTRTLTLEVSGDGHGVWDHDRVEQVVSNLVSNALTYGVPGTPVRVSSRGEEGAVVFEAHNQGAAIPEAERATLFDPFRRGKAQQTGRASKGLGLGLYIVDQITRAHGADVSVRSSESEGTTFTVRWPR